MTVHCPHCLTGYELPERLMGKRGARVRCPGCQGVFVVLPEGEVPPPAQEAAREVEHPLSPEATSPVASGGTGGHPAALAEPPAGPRYEPSIVARAVLDVLADFLGDALVRSRARGTVLSDHGPAIVAVWDEYRRRAGEDAPAAAFRAALKERCGVDLSHPGAR